VAKRNSSEWPAELGGNMQTERLRGESNGKITSGVGGRGKKESSIKKQTKQTRRGKRIMNSKQRKKGSDPDPAGPRRRGSAMPPGGGGKRVTHVMGGEEG